LLWRNIIAANFDGRKRLMQLSSFVIWSRGPDRAQMLGDVGRAQDAGQAFAGESDLAGVWTPQKLWPDRARPLPWLHYAGCCTLQASV